MRRCLTEGEGDEAPEAVGESRWRRASRLGGDEGSLLMGRDIVGKGKESWNGGVG